MTYKQIEAARERRLWLCQVIIPAITGTIWLRSNPQTRTWMDEKFSKLKTYVKEKFNYFKKKLS